MQTLLYILNIVSPVFILVILGIILRQVGMVNQVFVDVTSKFVFNVSLPALVFSKLIKADIGDSIDLFYISAILLLILFVFGISWIAGGMFTNNGKDKAAFIQGAFRSNFAIVGFAVINNMFGEEGLNLASIVLAFILPLYNFLAVIALTIPVSEEKPDIKKIASDVLRNPLILAVVVAIPFSLMNISMPYAIEETLGYLSAIALPLALIGIGGALNIKGVTRASGMALIASFLKIVLFPAIALVVSVLLGIKGIPLAVLFVLFATPTAIASFIMASAMGANEKLSGNIIIISTLLSVITITIGLYVMKISDLV